VHRVLVRHRLNRLAWMDRPTGQLIRRYERAHPGELVHMDVKKLGRIPPGGGWRAWGRGPGVPEGGGRAGYGFIHTMIDDYSRLAYAEALEDETAATATAFTQRGVAWFARLGIGVQALMTDNGSAYRSHLFQDTLAAVSIRHLRIRPCRPQTNGKAERFNRTLCDEWAYIRVYHSEAERRAQLDSWLHTYNHRRHHTAIGAPPITRVPNIPGQHT